MWLEIRDKSDRCEMWEEFNLREILHWWFWDGGVHGARIWKYPLDAESGLQWTASKKTRSSVLQPQETDFCHNPVSLEVDPELWMRKKPRQQLDFNFIRPWVEDSVKLCADFWPTERQDNKRVLFKASEFVLICYAAIEN